MMINIPWINCWILIYNEYINNQLILSCATNICGLGQLTYVQLIYTDEAHNAFNDISLNALRALWYTINKITFQYNYGT